MQNFKMSASIYLSCAPKYTISRLNNQFFSAEGAQPPPQTPSPAGRGTPLPAPYPLGTFGASLLAPSALVPHSKILATPLIVCLSPSVRPVPDAKLSTEGRLKRKEAHDTGDQ